MPRTARAARIADGARLIVAPGPLAPRKAAPVQLTPKMHPAQAFAAVTDACIYQLAANAPGAITGDDPEFIHQMRVALRRLRSALRLFREHLPVDFVAAVDPELRWLAALLGTARDWDVLLEATLPRLLRPRGGARAGANERALLAAIAPRRATARNAVRKALRSRRYTALLHRLSDAVHTLQGNEALDAVAGLKLLAFAARHLGRAAKKLRAKPAELAAMHSTERHQFRIRAKRLRYAVDFFSALFDADKTRRYAKRLAELQDALGLLNDHAVARGHLAALKVEPQLALLVSSRIEAQDRALIAEAVEGYARLRKAAPFWA